MGHPNSKKHKANHGGYRDKPSRGAINALCGMYAAIAAITIPTKNVKQTKPGEQLSLF